MPKKGSLHVSQLLSNVSVQYKSAEFIWDKIWGQIPVTKDTDLYRVYDRNFKIPETRRAPKGVARMYSFEFSTSSYTLEQHALKDYVGVDEAENEDLGDLEQDTTENLTDTIYRRVELMTASLFTKTSWSLSVSLAAGAAWTTNTTTSDPVPTVDTGASTIIANSGKTPNFMILPRAGYVGVKNHVSVLDRVKFTSADVTHGQVATLFGFTEMHVPTAVYDSAAIGIAFSSTPFWTNAFLGWKPTSPGKKQPSCGYHFIHSKPRVRKWFSDERNATAVEVEVKIIPKVVASLTGYLIGGIS